MSKNMHLEVSNATAENLKSHARHSNRIKSLYLSKLIKNGSIDKDTLVINEFANLHAGARADIAVVTGLSTEAIEIKSSSDSLSRLSRQIDTYLRCFNKVTIVTAENHLENVIALTVGTTVGVVLFNGKAFRQIKRPKKSVVEMSIIWEKLMPKKLNERNIGHREYVDYIKEKYSANMVQVRKMLEKGYVTESDVAALNPAYIRREKFRELERSVGCTWAELTKSLQIDPLFLGKASDRNG